MANWNKRQWLVLLLAMAWWGLALQAESNRAHAAEANDEETVVEEEAVEVDPLKVPAGGAKEMAAFLQQLAQMEPEGETELEKLRYRGLIFRAMADAADQGLASEPTDRETQMMAYFKMMALQQLAKTADQEFKLAAKEARQDDRSGVASMGWQVMINDVASNWNEKSDEEKKAFREELLGDFPSDPKQAAARANAVRMAASYLDRIDNQYAKELMEEAVAQLESSDVEEVRKAAEQLAGMLRRMNLMGSEMEINGTLLDGQELDWKSYRGKVVLVDFWATWCGPCVAELPNVKEQYAAYHDKGFDVLGISLDDAPDKVEKFLQEKEIPWGTLFGGPNGENDLGWNQPMARYYGITGIPTAILVDRDGKVVHMNARGPALKEELKKLLGDPSPKEDSADSVDEKEKATEAAGG